jgi:SAM-dependent methyltransferase
LAACLADDGGWRHPCISETIMDQRSARVLTVDRLALDVPAPNEGAHRTNTFRSLLDLVATQNKRRLLDLGAGPCIFSRIARDRGYSVTAVDGRTVRVPEASDLGSIRFICADVRDFDVSNFDVILIFGLLYHLDIGDQRALLERCAYGADVMIDTQIHDPQLVVASPPRPWETTIRHRSGYTGIEYPESDNPMASVGNRISFWHTYDSALRLFSDCGFSRVLIIDPAYQSKYGARRFFLIRP